MSNKPKCDLLNCDGNIFALMGKACETLERAGQRDKAKELRGKLFSFGSYDAALAGIMEYVEVADSEDEDGDGRFCRRVAEPEDDEEDDSCLYDEPCLDCGAEEGEPCTPNCSSGI